MSGHSKWSTIKHQKAQMDQRRGALFSKLGREIAIAAREGKSDDPEQNPRLRTILVKARAANMPSDNIRRAIERGLGVGGESGFEEVIYEGYGPSGVAVIIIAHTDNRLRTVAYLKHVFEHREGSLGSPGCAAFLFEKRDGQFFPKVKLPIEDEGLRQKLRDFLLELSSAEDVASVYSNADLGNE